MAGVGALVWCNDRSELLDRDPGPKPIVRGAKSASHAIELRAWRLPDPIGVELELIATVAGENVQVDVEDLLKCGFPVGQEEIGALAPHARRARGRRRALSHGPEMAARRLDEVGEIRRVRLRDGYELDEP